MSSSKSYQTNTAYNLLKDIVILNRICVCTLTYFKVTCSIFFERCIVLVNVTRCYMKIETKQKPGRLCTIETDLE